MHEMTAETAAKLFMAHEEALEHAAAKIYRLLTQDAGLTPAECFVVCLRAAAKFLAQHDKNEWKEMVQHASELLLQHAVLTSRVSGDNAPAKQPPRPEGPGGHGGGDEYRTVAEGDHVRTSPTTERRAAKGIAAPQPPREAEPGHYRADLARVIPDCCACATCSVKPLPMITTATAIIRAAVI
jgi:hypothetical protein